jgi:hypothetical protein
MKHTLTCLGIFVSLLCFGRASGAQSPADQAKKSDEIVLKMRKIDLLTQIIPLALTKDQINKLLPAIERARAKVAAVVKAEAADLLKLDGKLNEAIKTSIENGTTPPKKLLDELALDTATLSEKRLVAIDENTELVLKSFEDTVNAGQKKAAANSLAPQLFDPSLKPDKMTIEEKVRFFVKQILLDPQAYDVLIELAKHAS